MYLIFKLINKILINVKSYETPFKRKLYKFFFKKKKHLVFQSGTKEIKNGFFNCKLEDLKAKGLGGHIDKVFLTANDIIENINDIKSTGTKKYLRNLLGETNTNSIQIFLDFILNDYFLKIIKEYLEEEPLLIELKLLLSPTNLESDNQLQGSQLFHRDFDDEKIVKIFFYLTDIDDKTGPLQILGSDISNKITKNNRLNYALHSDKIENFVNKDKDILTLKGKKGDCFFVDTSNCYHRGSRLMKKDRYILYANFSTRSNFRFPPIFLNSKNDKIISNHSPLIKFTSLIDEKKTFYLRNS